LPELVADAASEHDVAKEGQLDDIRHGNSGCLGRSTIANLRDGLKRRRWPPIDTTCNAAQIRRHRRFPVKGD